MSYIVSLQDTFDDVGFGETLKKLAIVKIGLCLGIISLYHSVYYMAQKRASEKAINGTSSEKKIKKELRNEVPKPRKPSLGDSIKEVSKSREIKAMATMVVCYNICIELTEVLWKGILRKQFPSKSSYMKFMANFSQIVGVVSLILQLLASSIIRKLGWKLAASLTPITMFTMAVPFFVSVYMATSERYNLNLALALAIGTWQNVASKVTKYSLFDPCKEMAYIPLGPEAKVKGKAAVDVMGARLGRSLGSASQQFLVSLASDSSILGCAPSLGIIYMTTVYFWINAVSTLGKLFTTPSEGKSEEKK